MSAIFSGMICEEDPFQSEGNHHDRPDKFGIDAMRIDSVDQKYCPDKSNNNSESHFLSFVMCFTVE